MMKAIIPKVNKSLLEAELTESKFVRNTNYGNNKIYILSYHDSPMVMREIGRLRELSFRNSGGGTGKQIDIDHFDTDKICFKQLIVWEPEDKEIVGGYRFIHCKDLSDNKGKKLQTPTSRLFNYSEKFIKEYLPYTIELGRSFVQPIYQLSNNSRKGIYSLDNLWDGLGAIIVDNPDVKYFFGKITMYPNLNPLARDMILYFLKKYFPDNEKLVYPFKPLKIKTDLKKLENIFNGYNYDEDYKILIRNVRNLKENIPPLVNAYISLSSTMKTFGTTINTHFGNVEETGIIINISDIYNIKKDRHVLTYKK